MSPERFTVPDDEIPVNPLIAPVALMSPLFATVNLLTPLADAVSKSPELTLFTLNAALLPIPPDTDNTAGVLLEEPIYTPLLKSVLIIVCPVPFGVRVKLPLPPVAILSAPVSERLFAESVWVLPLMIKPLIVLVAVAPVIAPDRFNVVTPLTALLFILMPLMVLDVAPVIDCNVLNAPF